MATTLENIATYTQETARLDKENLRQHLKALELQILHKNGSQLQVTKGLSACTLIIRNNNFDYYDAKSKRQALRIIGLIGSTTKFLTKRCLELISLTAIGFTHHRRILSACNAALNTIYDTQRLFMSISFLQIFKKIQDTQPNKHQCILQILRTWRDKAAQCALKIPIAATHWDDILQGLMTLPPDTTKHDHPKGHVQWRSKAKPKLKADSEIHITWNVNGLRQRWNSGELIDFITKYNPTTLHLTEIKTDLYGLKCPDELRHTLRHFGYSFCIWNWCTKTIAGNKGSGNFGSAVFSKLPFTGVTYGMNHQDTDTEGRVITATVAKRNFIWVYAPCSRTDDNAPRSLLRTTFDKALTNHYKKIKLDRGKDTYIMGDLNVAPTPSDCTTFFASSTSSWPSTKHSERQAFHERLKQLNLVDAYAATHPNLQNEAHALHHMSWLSQNSKDDEPNGLRIDHFLFNANGTQPTSCRLSPSTFGSDHKALITTFGNPNLPEKEKTPTRTAIEDDCRNEKHDKRVLHRRTTPQAPSKSSHWDLQHINHLQNHKATTYLTKDDDLNLQREYLNAIHRPFNFRTSAMSNRKNHNLHLSNINEDDSPLPVVNLRIGKAKHATATLVDTGAKGLFMPMAHAQRLNLHIQPSNTVVTVGDNSTLQCCGQADLAITIANTTFLHPVNILPDCPYDLIIGMEFIKKYISNIDFVNNKLLFRCPLLPADKNQIWLPFNTSSLTSLITTAPTTLPPLAEKIVFVRPAVPDATLANLTEEERWGYVEPIRKQHSQYQCANGIMRVETPNSESANWIKLVNASDKPITIKQGAMVARFYSQNFHSTLLNIIDDTDTSYQEEHLSEKELNAIIDETPHLKDLRLHEQCTNLTPEQRVRLKRLVLRYKRLWDTTPKPVPDNAYHAEIRLKKARFEEQARYIPMNPTSREQLREIIEDKLRRAIVVPSESACSSTVLMVPKPSGGLRFCVDYRALNKAIAPDAYTLPNVSENLSALGGSNKYFTSLDMKEAFWNVPLTKASQELTAFRTPDGLYMYKRLPMGLKTASAVFSRYIDSVLGELKWDSILVYIDDLLIATPTFDEHINLMEKVFARLDAANLTLGAKKCALAQAQVSFLGHIVSQDGLAPDPKKVKAVSELSLPQSQADLHSALGLMGYYRKFILNYAAITEPLRKKLAAKWEKDGSTKWTHDEEEAFYKIRDALTKSPILAHPNWSHPFEVHTDASHKGLGAVLCQKIDNKEHVIAYASRAVTKTEIPYSTWELECLAMIWATRLFRMYLQNTTFKIFTDSKAAKALLENNDSGAGGRLLRWRLALTEFDFTVHHRAGTKNANADALSRLYIKLDDPYDEGPTRLHPKTNLNSLDTTLTNIYFPPSDSEAWTTQDWIREQKQDDLCKRIKLRLRAKDKDVAEFYYTNEDGLLLRKPNTNKKDLKEQTKADTILTPESLKAFILTRYHSLPIAGHKGRDKTLSLIRKRYYWPGMSKDVAKWIRSCATCKKRKTPRPLHSDKPASLTTTRRWQCIAIDLVEAGTTSLEKYKYILTVICMFTRYAITIPIKTKKARDVADALFTYVFAVHGKPREIRSDEGKEFVNAGLARLYRKWNIDSITTGGYRPWSNPVERYHRYLNAGMTSLASTFGEDWTSYLQAITFTYNTSVCESTGFSPYYLMHLRDPLLLEDIEPLPNQVDELKDNGDICNATMRLATAYATARDRQERMAKLNRQRLAKSCKPVTFAVDDWVLYWEPAQSLSHKTTDDTQLIRQLPSKWKPRWTGPHRIVKRTEGKYNPRYSIEHNGRSKVITNVKADKLTPYTPWSESLPSTHGDHSIDITNTSAYQIGSECAPDQLFIIPLTRPWPFGLARLISVRDDGSLHFQWYGTEGNGGKSVATAYKPMWWTGQEAYIADTKRERSHTPYTDEHEGDAMRQADICLHSFTLTDTARLPAAILKACATHADIWWQPRTRKPQTHKSK